MNRAELTKEYHQIEHQRTITQDERRRMDVIVKLLAEAICRNCDKHYNEHKSRADYTGFCSAKCLHAKAKEMGYRKGVSRSEYDVLKRSDCIGSIHVIS